MSLLQKGLSNFEVGAPFHGGLLHEVASLDKCQNCGTGVYFIAKSADNRNTILDSYPKLDLSLTPPIADAKLREETFHYTKIL